MFVMVDCGREMIGKKSCIYGDYGLFEHLFFLFIVFILFLLMDGCGYFCYANNLLSLHLKNYV